MTRCIARKIKCCRKKKEKEKKKNKAASRKMLINSMKERAEDRRCEDTRFSPRPSVVSGTFDGRLNRIRGRRANGQKSFNQL